MSQFLFNAHYRVLNINKQSRIIHDKSKTSVIGANMSFKKEIFDKTSGFFEHFKLLCSIYKYILNILKL